MATDMTLVEEALAAEKPQAWGSLPFLALFSAVFAMVAVVGSVMVAAADLLSRRSAPSASDAIRHRERMRTNAANHLQVLPPARF
jgi:hypothetical protein